jgi:predicted patatin/cPLA2 family phospholipase
MDTANNDFRILSLDGGGAKGVYTLGILKEIEALTGRRICDEFDLIYGTSTGAIIAALLGLGKSVDEVTKNYFDIVPNVMGEDTRGGRSRALKEQANKLLGDKKFDAFVTDVGIVAIHYEDTKPMIFKSSIRQAHGTKSTFKPGFGCTISEALRASSAAYPFFERVKVITENQGEPELIDGGFIANNPTLLAIADGVKAYKIEKKNLKVLSLGVGVYKQPKPGLKHRVLFWFDAPKLAVKVMEASTNTIEQLRLILFPDISCVRINDSFSQEEYATDLLESDINKLKKLNTLGRRSFSKYEQELKEKFGW